MSSRFTRFAGVAVIFMLAIGCATKPSVSESQWRAQKERQQRAAREAGRIGYIGNAPPSVGNSTFSSSSR